MWNSRHLIQLKSLWQDASYRRLALALGVSLLLHLFLFGQFHFNFRGFKQPYDLIEVRLVLPKIAENLVQKPVAKVTPTVKPVKFEKQIPLKEAPTSEQVVPPKSEFSSSINLPKNDDVAPDEQPQTLEALTEPQSEAIIPIKRPKPYEYIESDFDVYTDPDSVSNRVATGVAKVTYHQLPNGEQYKLKSLIQAKGLVSLVIPDLLQTSEGFLDGVGLQPVHYLYQFGDKKDKTYKADFDWDSKKLTLQSEKGKDELDLQGGTQDLLSFMYQFMFVPPMQNMQLSITNGKKLGVYDYVFVGEESVSTKIGNLNTYHIERVAEEGEKKTELWLALDYQHVPVKIRETDKHGKVYELVITNLIARTEPLPLP